ncbi:MAG TPA: TOMM precursor leader peptide-binding protein [Solirubrobacterales bacterium]|nr:TOMM precursor leader peptide-binding protein [Solirubrobacterales bacterium]
MQPRLKRTIEPILAPDGDLVLMRSSAEDIRITRPSRQERALLRALDGSHSLEELEARFGAREAGDAIAQMQELDLVEDAADDGLVPAEDLERFDRQMRYFSDLSRNGGPTPSECQTRLREARVAVLGVGGLGGRVAFELACCGVGEILLVDGDRIEISNLNRQIQYTETDIGLLKVEVMAARLRAFNSQIRVMSIARRMESQAQLADYIDGADVVVDTADWPAFEIEAWCNAACFEAGIPHIGMAQIPPKIRVGPLYVPGVTGCHECQRIAWRRDYPLFDVAIEQRKGQPYTAATLGPSSGLIGAQIGMDVMHFLTGLVEPASLSTACMYDLRTMEVERTPVVAEPECPVCSHLQLAVAT